MKSDLRAIPQSAAREVSLAAIQDLAPKEIPVLLGELEVLIEMAEEGELLYIDPRDSGGGFDATDPLFLTLVPVVVGVLRDLRNGKDPQTLWSGLSMEIERVAKTVGSKQAHDRQAAMKDAIRRACENLFPPTSGEG